MKQSNVVPPISEMDFFLKPFWVIQRKAFGSYSGDRGKWFVTSLHTRVIRKIFQKDPDRVVEYLDRFSDLSLNIGSSFALLSQIGSKGFSSPAISSSEVTFNHSLVGTKKFIYMKIGFNEYLWFYAGDCGMVDTHWLTHIRDSNLELRIWFWVRQQ